MIYDWNKTSDRLPTSTGLFVGAYGNDINLLHYVNGKWHLHTSNGAGPVIENPPDYWYPIPDMSEPETKTEYETKTVRQANISILDHLGGEKFLTMTGSIKIAAIGGKSLKISLPQNLSKAHYLTIMLNDMGTYDMLFQRETGGYVNEKEEWKEIKRKTIAEHKNVAYNRLQDVFTTVTGLKTHL